MPYILYLDGLRCLAVSWVLLFHFSQYGLLTFGGLVGFAAARGWMGVDLFFVISGFLITSILLREHANTGRISLKKFYIRRALRIWPAYYLMILGTLLAALLIITVYPASKSSELVLRTIKWPAMYLTDMYTAYANTERCTLLHSWSLAIEEQFYLIWPLILCWNVKQAKRVAIVSIIAIAAWRTWLTYHLPEGVIAMRRTYYAPDTRMDQLMFGALLAFIVLNEKQFAILARLVRIHSVQLAIAGIFLTALYINVRWSGHIGNALGYSMSAFSIAMGLGYVNVVQPKWILAALESRPMVYIGRISYGMYLFQPFIVMGLRRVFGKPENAAESIALCMAAYLGTIIVATASYRYFESPFLRLKGHFSAFSKPQTVTLEQTTA